MTSSSVQLESHFRVARARSRPALNSGKLFQRQIIKAAVEKKECQAYTDKRPFMRVLLLLGPDTFLFWRWQAGGGRAERVSCHQQRSRGGSAARARRAPRPKVQKYTNVTYYTAGNKEMRRRRQAGSLPD
jgi:hypothetical protein